MYVVFVFNYGVLIYEKVLSMIVFVVFVNWYWEILVNMSFFYNICIDYYFVFIDKVEDGFYFF